MQPLPEPLPAESCPARNNDAAIGIYFGSLRWQTRRYGEPTPKLGRESDMNALVALLKRQWHGVNRGGAFDGRSPYPDFDEEERESLQERKDGLLQGVLTWMVGVSIPLLVFVLIPEWWGRVGLSIWIAKALLGTPIAFFLGAGYTVVKYDAAAPGGTISCDRWWWPGGVVVAASEWIVIGITIWRYGWPS